MFVNCRYSCIALIVYSSYKNAQAKFPFQTFKTLFYNIIFYTLFTGIVSCKNVKES